MDEGKRVFKSAMGQLKDLMKQKLLKDLEEKGEQQEEQVEEEGGLTAAKAEGWSFASNLP